MKKWQSIFSTNSKNVDVNQNLCKDFDILHEDQSIPIQTNHKSRKFRIHNRRQGAWVIELRYDIMNKNFIRAIKREYKAIYNDFIANQGLKNTKSHLIRNTEFFISELLANTSINWCETNNFSVDILSVYTMALTQFFIFKKLSADKQSIKIREQVYDLLYPYSHERFYSFIGVPEIKVLILMLREKHSKRDFAKLVTFSNISTYETHIESIMRRIRLYK